MKEFLIQKNCTIIEALKQISKSGEKSLIVVNSNEKFLGILSDGDLRRAILNKKKLTESISKIYNSNSFYLIENNYNLENVKKRALKQKIYFIPIINNNKKVINLLTSRDLFSEKKNKKIKNQNIPVVIMAGGFGTRLEPFTKVLPKPLIPIDGKPIIDHIMESFKSSGTNTFYITLNYKSKILKSYFEELNHKYKIFFIEEKNPLGTAGALYLLKNKISKNFFVTNSDIILNTDYIDLYNFHSENKNDITLVVAAKEYEIPYGSCEISSNGDLLKINEKPKFNFLINSGLYLLNNKILKLLKKNKKTDMNELIDLAIKNKFKIKIYPVSEKQWIDVGQWVEYKKIVEKLN